MLKAKNCTYVKMLRTENCTDMKMLKAKNCTYVKMLRTENRIEEQSGIEMARRGRFELPR